MGADGDALKQRMAGVFNDQQTYDGYLDSHQGVFDAFVQRIKQSVATSMAVDDIHQTSQRKLIRPSRKRKDAAQVEMTDVSDLSLFDPVFGNYYGFQDSFYYGWLWSEMAYNHGLRIHDVAIVDEVGRNVIDVGHAGFVASETNTLNPDAAFEPPRCGDDVIVYGDSQYAACFPEVVASSDGTADISAGTSWLDGFSSSSDSSSGADSSGGSSCSSGSNCGSSCGSSCGSCGGGGD
jgi:uncharacterized membrane protein YgcG